MQGRPGGSLSLARLIKEHGEAIEADFARFYPQDPDPQAVTLRRLGVLLRGLLKTPESLLYKALADDTWTRTDHLLALVHDQLAIANWQRTKAGRKGTNRPKPLSPLAQRGKRYGRTDRPPEEVKAFLARLNPAQHRAGQGGEPWPRKSEPPT